MSEQLHVYHHCIYTGECFDVEVLELMEELLYVKEDVKSQDRMCSN